MGRLKPNYGRVPATARTCTVAPTVTVDGKSVPVTEVETPLLNIILPEDNIFGLPAGTKVCPWGTAGSRSYTR